MNTETRYLSDIKGLQLTSSDRRLIKNVVNDLGEGCHPVVTEETVHLLAAGYVITLLLKALPLVTDEQRILDLLTKLEG